MATPLEEWVEEQARLTKPDKIYWCDGSEEEAQRLIEIGMEKETVAGRPVFYELNQKNFKNAFLHRSHPTDVARTEKSTVICYDDKVTAGPNNNWMDPAEAKQMLTKLSDGSMKGRTMYVLPFVMGHPDSPYSRVCVQLTDISYVAVNMRIMTRLGKDITERIGNRDDFLKGIHTIGNFNKDDRYIVHFPQEDLVWSVNSGYGGNALLGKKCISLRLASWKGYHEGWLAEHMLILGVEDPNGQITYIAAALPSACGKTNLAVMQSKLPGYKIWTLGDDIAWLNVGPDGRLWAINPEAGFFGVAPGTSYSSNPNMMDTLKAGQFFPTLFTNVAYDIDTGEPWWEEKDDRPANLLDWQGNRWHADSGTTAAHPNSRFTVSITQTPTLSSEFENPRGVPISAILFGARRTDTVPLVTEAFDWTNGVFAGARMGSETTAAAALKVGALRRDPMAMLPFCGYNMGDYFGHWLRFEERLTHPPKIFSINWFQRDEGGKFLWPGFGDNVRVLKWIVDRVNNSCGAQETPIGLVPNMQDLPLDGLDVSTEQMSELLAVDRDQWRAELEGIKANFEKFGDRLPSELWAEYHKLQDQLSKFQ